MDSPQSNMDLLADFKSFQDLIQSSLVNVTRSATQVSNQDLSFHRSSSEKLSRSLDRQNAHLLRLTNKLLKAATQDTHRKPAVLQNQDDIEDNWRGVVDVVDDLLEKADSALDEFSGAIKRGSPAPQDATSNPKSSKFENNSERWNSHVMQKPQQFFDRKINNSDATPFKPLLQSKPHATVPLADSIGNDANAYVFPTPVSHFLADFGPDLNTPTPRRSRTIPIQIAYISIVLQSPSRALMLASQSTSIQRKV